MTCYSRSVEDELSVKVMHKGVELAQQMACISDLWRDGWSCGTIFATACSPLPTLPSHANKPPVLRIATPVRVRLQKLGRFGEVRVAGPRLPEGEAELLHKLLRRGTASGFGGAALWNCWQGLVPRLHTRRTSFTRAVQVRPVLGAAQLIRRSLRRARHCRVQ